VAYIYTGRPWPAKVSNDGNDAGCVRQRRPGGALMQSRCGTSTGTYSCPAAIGGEVFEHVVDGAAAGAGRRGRL
jgi:hypothetical protein